MGLLEDALHLLELVHERRAGVQPARRVDEQDVRPPGLRRLDRVERDRAGIGAAGLGHDVRTGSVRPDRELLRCGGAERIAVREAHLVAGCDQSVRELADRHGLPGAIHADHHHHREAAEVDVEVVAARQDLGDLVGDELRGIVVVPVPLLHALDDRPRGLRSDVSANEDVLQPSPCLLGRGGAGEQASDPRGAVSSGSRGAGRATSASRTAGPSTVRPRRRTTTAVASPTRATNTTTITTTSAIAFEPIGGSLESLRC